MRISDWSSDVCSSDLRPGVARLGRHQCGAALLDARPDHHCECRRSQTRLDLSHRRPSAWREEPAPDDSADGGWHALSLHADEYRSEEHTSELQSLMRISYAVVCLKHKNTQLVQTNPLF